jgi:hypothetical protein
MRYLKVSRKGGRVFVGVADPALKSHKGFPSLKLQLGVVFQGECTDYRGKKIKAWGWFSPDSKVFGFRKMQYAINHLVLSELYIDELKQPRNIFHMPDSRSPLPEA